MKLQIKTAKEDLEPFPNDLFINQQDNDLLTPFQSVILRSNTLLSPIRCQTKNSDLTPQISFDFRVLSVLTQNNGDEYIEYYNCNRSENYKDIVNIREKNPYEIIKHRKTGILSKPLVKAILRIKSAFSEGSTIITTSRVFRNFIFVVILLNIVFLAIEDRSSNAGSAVRKNFDIFFLAVYSCEFILKIWSRGIILSKNSYFRNGWNILDSIVVITTWIDFVGEDIINLQVLRAFRVLRPLKSLSSLKGLRLIIIALISSIKPLIAAFSLFLLAISIFAIAGMQMWLGLFRNRCLDLDSGIVTEQICGNYNCGFGSKCVSSLDNPYMGIVNFDNFFFGALVVYQCITLEGWTDILDVAERTFGEISLVYFLPLVFVGSLIFLNIFMAIIKSAFSKAIFNVQESVKRAIDYKQLKTTSLMSHYADVNESSTENHDMTISARTEKYRINLPQSTSQRTFLSMKSRFTIKSPAIKELSPTLAVDRSPQGSYTKLGIDSTPASKSENNSYLKNIGILFSRMNSNLKVNKEALDRINKGQKFETTSINITNYILNSSSIEDLHPSYWIFRLNTLKKSDFYTFIYKSSDETEQLRVWKNEIDFNISGLDEESTDLQKFIKLAGKYNENSAFYSIYYPVNKFCKKFRKIDFNTKNIEGVWSGQDVDSKIKDSKIEKMNFFRYTLWSKGFKGVTEKLRYPIIRIIENKIFSVAILCCIVTNTIVLSIDHYGISSEMQNNLQAVNIVFTYIFCVEMVIKILAYGLKKYIRDLMSLFDAVIVILSLVEIYFLSQSKSSITAFRAAMIFRVFKVLRILRIAKLFRYLKFMAHLITVIGRSVSKYIYLGLLLLLLLMIYSLIGMQIFAGKLKKVPETRANFDSFHWSFVSTFQVLSVENWQSILYLAMSSDAGYASCIFFISWIILGNYIIMNLFLAILLESFSRSEVEDNIKIEKENLFKGYNQRMKKKQEEKLKLIEDLNSDSEVEQEDELYQNTLKTMIFHHPGKSFYLFPIDNKFRALCLKLTFSHKFEYFILIVICLSSLKLAVDTYISNYPDAVQVSDIFNYIFSGIFMIEFIIKCVSRGFILGEGSYLKDKWNYIDFIVVISSVVDLATSSVSFALIKVARLLRTLRPFRYINFNYSMKIMVIALLQSIVAIFNVVIVQGIVLLMFAILGVSLLAGKLYNCSDRFYTDQDSCESAGFDWELIWPNYNNLLNSLTTMFILSSEEGWPDIMAAAIDAKDVKVAPEYNTNPMIAYYFIIFITISSFFFMNLFIGVVYEKFNEAKEQESSLAAAVLTKDQMIWIEMQKLIVKATPKSDAKKKPEGIVRKLFYRIFKSVYFQVVIILCITLNMVCMAFQYYGASDDMVIGLETLNLIFTLVFVAEAIVKILALGVLRYFKKKSNFFDFVVVVLSCVDIILTYVLGSAIKLLRKGPQMIRIVRVLRVSKFIRLFKSLESLKTLIDIITYSLPAIGNVLALLLLIFFIYAIIGVNLFSNVESGKILNTHLNFSTFGQAMLILFRCSTGEDWYKIMFDCGQKNGMFLSQAYFISFITLVVFVMLNLFAMVIIQNYEELENSNFNVPQLFAKEVKKIRVLWNFYTKEFNGEKIHLNGIANVIKEMKEFGFNFDSNNEMVIKFMRALDLESDMYGFVYYNQFLFAILKKKYVKKGFGIHFRKVLFNEEKMTKMKIKRTIEDKNKKCGNSASGKMEHSTVSNFVIERMYLKTVFRNWKAYTERRLKKRIYVEFN